MDLKQHNMKKIEANRQLTLDDVIEIQIFFISNKELHLPGVRRLVGSLPRFPRRTCR